MLDIVTPLVDTPAHPAAQAGLEYIAPDSPGISRQKWGKSFRYRNAGGARIADKATLARIKSLVIPPAWSEVWICPEPSGHLQATGRDAKGRRQYRYHPQFRAHRESGKFEHLMEFAEALPVVRATVKKHLSLPGLPREKVLAGVVSLLETTLIRVGNDQYARQNKSYGLTTLRNRHAKVEGASVRFKFKGKSGKLWNLQIRDRRIAKIIRSCQELPGQQLLQYRDAEGGQHGVSSSDVNAYLKEISGKDITAKDFRTFAGTVQAALALHAMEASKSAAESKRNLRAAIEKVSARLGNTVAICRKCYVHPEIMESYTRGQLQLTLTVDVMPDDTDAGHSLSRDELAVLAFLQGKSGKEQERQA